MFYLIGRTKTLNFFEKLKEKSKQKHTVFCFLLIFFQVCLACSALSESEISVFIFIKRDLETYFPLTSHSHNPL